MKKQTQIDRFADLMAEHGSTQRVAHRMGISMTYSNALMQRLRRLMGSQAV